MERFHQNQRVIEDFTRRTLAAIPNQYGRLAYVSSLRDLSSGKYQHDGLATVYSQGAVQYALAHCHSELFARLLETPLEQQEWDFRSYLSALEGDFWRIVENWQEMEPYRLLVPAETPDYLRDLFFANVRALLELFAEEAARSRTAA